MYDYKYIYIYMSVCMDVLERFDINKLHVIGIVRTEIDEHQQTVSKSQNLSSYEHHACK